jgi:hypothetical protein
MLQYFLNDPFENWSRMGASVSSGSVSVWIMNANVHFNLRIFHWCEPDEGRYLSLLK